MVEAWTAMSHPSLLLRLSFFLYFCFSGFILYHPFCFFSYPVLVFVVFFLVTLKCYIISAVFLVIHTSAIWLKTILCAKIIINCEKLFENSEVYIRVLYIVNVLLYHKKSCLILHTLRKSISYCYSPVNISVWIQREFDWLVTL